MGEAREHSIVLTNLGETDLLIKEVIPSCDCMEVTYSQDAVSTGGRAEVKIRLTGDEQGDFYKSVFIYDNAADSPQEVILSGKIE